MSDVIIIGGGPAGAVLGSYLSRAGISNTIIEKSMHPRPHVGESLAGHRFTAHGLAAHGFAGQPAGSTMPDAKAFTHPYANDLWMSDVMHGPRLLVPGKRRGEGDRRGPGPQGGGLRPTATRRRARRPRSDRSSGRVRSSVTS